MHSWKRKYTLKIPFRHVKCFTWPESYQNQRGSHAWKSFLISQHHFIPGFSFLSKPLLNRSWPFLYWTLKKTTSKCGEPGPPSEAGSASEKGPARIEVSGPNYIFWDVGNLCQYKHFATFLREHTKNSSWPFGRRPDVVRTLAVDFTKLSDPS